MLKMVNGSFLIWYLMDWRLSENEQALTSNKFYGLEVLEAKVRSNTEVLRWSSLTLKGCGFLKPIVCLAEVTSGERMESSLSENKR